MRVLRFETPLGLFSVLWALAAALHHLEAQPLEGLPIYPFSALLFLYPERIWAIAGFALAHTVLLWGDLPTAANHSVIALMVNVGLLIGCARALRRDAAHSRCRRLWESVRGPLQATVIVVYALALLHKLNSSFLDPHVSCATSQMAKMFALHGFTEPADVSAFAFNMHLTLIVETAIVVLLIWPRFAYLGVTVGLLFHTALGWAQFFDFATVVFALYLFFLPWDAIQKDMSRIPSWAGSCFIACFAVLTGTSIYFHGFRANATITEWANWSFEADSVICAAWTLMVWPILAPIFIKGVVWRSDRRWTGVVMAWVIPVAALLNGVTPYVGLKTVANYSMFSNLRTEGGRTNHFLVPAGRLFLAEYQNDLVRIQFIRGFVPERLPLRIQLMGARRWMRRNSRWLSEVPGVRIPFAEVRRTLQLWEQTGFTRLSIGYERGGQRFIAADASSDPELMRPLSFWERKLLAFRAIQDDGEESRCRW
jgi:hypothetical protein